VAWQRLASDKGAAGIKALLIYPMNALATDQARRFAQVIARTPAFNGLRVGLFFTTCGLRPEHYKKK
jgi:DEAD/DEAH box helicase domain-containing protein